MSLSPLAAAIPRSTVGRLGGIGDHVGAVVVHDPFFFAVTSPVFERSRIADLAGGRCAAIRVPNLLPRKQCDQVLSALSAVEFASYAAMRVYPPVLRFGVGVSDHRRAGQVADTYWPALEAGRKAWLELGLPFDPYEMCRSAIGASWPHAVRVGRSGGREMGAGVAREPNQGFIVHFDDALREFSGNLLDASIVAQFAFNLYLSVPEEGGETVVWRHRWHPGDERHRLPGSYGYDDNVIDGAECFELKPSVGEALLFDPRNFHAVRPSRDSRRIALGFSMGLTDTGELWTWG
jgi:2OG-Fe(II) oxygenase superfamily